MTLFFIPVLYALFNRNHGKSREESQEIAPDNTGGAL
jgi:hypothetical protein